MTRLRDNGRVSDPVDATQSESGGRRPPVDESGDDWHWDDAEWFEDHRPQGSESGSSGAPAGGEPPTDLIAAANDDQAAPFAARSAVIRRRRIAAFSVLVLLIILAVVVPLVVFGGGGSVAEQTAPLTTAERTTSTSRTTTRPPTTTASTVTSPDQTPLRVALPRGQSLRRGDRGAAVESLQKGLAALKFATGTPDGVFGATTEAAVVDFQQSNNLPPDGIVGTDTVRLLNTALAAKGVTG